MYTCVQLLDFLFYYVTLTMYYTVIQKSNAKFFYFICIQHPSNSTALTFPALIPLQVTTRQAFRLSLKPFSLFQQLQKY